AHCSISRITQPGTNSKSKHNRWRSSYSATSGSNDTAAAEVLRGPSARTVDQHASGPATAKTLDLQRLRAWTNVRGPLRRTDSGAKLQRSSERQRRFRIAIGFNSLTQWSYPLRKRWLSLRLLRSKQVVRPTLSECPRRFCLEPPTQRRHQRGDEHALVPRSSRRLHLPERLQRPRRFLPAVQSIRYWR